MKVLVFLDHDILVRHFVYSGVLDDMIKNHDVIFVFPEGNASRISLKINSREHNAPCRRVSINPIRRRIWSWWFHADQMRWRPGSDYKFLRRFRRQSHSLKENIFLTILGLPLIFQLFVLISHRQLKQHPAEALEELIDEEHPDILLHPTVLYGLFVNDLITVGKQKNIPVVMQMNSWDNPSTKRSMIGNPDWLLVWGDQSKQHAIQYANMPESRAIKFGAAQFEVYRAPPRIDHLEFCRNHDIDPTKLILLYAGSSKGTDEFAHLQRLETAIDNGEIDNIAILYRPHPWGGAGKQGDRIIDYPWRHVRLERSMLGYLQTVKSGTHTISIPDYKDTRDVLRNVDAMLSPVSTILLEAAILGCPVMCFLPNDEKHEAAHYAMTASLVHLLDLYYMPGIIIAENGEQLICKTNELLACVGDANVSQTLQKGAHYFVEPFEAPYGERLTSFLESVCESHSEAATVPFHNKAS